MTPNPHRSSTIWPALLLALLALALGPTACNNSSPEIAPPPTAATTLNSLLTQYHLQGKIVLIQFGSVGCQLSDEGLKRMTYLQNNKVLPALSYLRVEQSDDPAAIDAYYKTISPPFPVHRDPQAALAVSVSATAYPTCILVDKFAHVRYRGKFPESMGEWVAMLAAEKTDPGTDLPMLGAATLDIPALLRHTTLPTLAASQTQPLTQYMGKSGLLIVFVDTSCPFSAQAMKDIPTVAPKLAAHNIPTVLVNLDDPLSKVQPHYAGKDLGVPVVYDVTTATKLNWNISSVPTLVFISPDQQNPYTGTAVWKDLASAIETNLKLPPGSIQLGAQGTGFG